MLNYSDKGQTIIMVISMKCLTWRKQAYSNILKNLQPKQESCQIKNSDIFHIPAQNIDCEY